MQAKDFYELKSNSNIQIKILSESAFKNIKGASELKKTLTALDFLGKPGDIAKIINDGVLQEIYIGQGDAKNNDLLAKAVTKLPAGHYCLDCELEDNVLISWAAAQYKFSKYKENKELPRVLSLKQDVYTHIVNKANSIFIVRDLINTPTNDLGPAEMAGVVEELATQHAAEFEQWVGEDLLTHNFPAIYTVGKGSSSKPRLLSLTWGNPKHPLLTLVGKGVCFDSGGLDIKPSAGMRIMKKDMGGAAHVIGLAKWIMSEEIPVRLQVYIPAVENSVDGNAYRPGDIIKMRSGLTVEIDNTDAEGRLVLADAIVKACEDKPDLLIDFATLTGAARIAVGTGISAMFANNDELAEQIAAKGEQSCDPIWRLPLFAGYDDLLESNIADLSNCGKTSYGGAITAALFLQRFVGEKVKWAHFDIMAWNLTASPGKPEGGEAMGIIAVANYLQEKYS